MRYGLSPELRGYMLAIVSALRRIIRLAGEEPTMSIRRALATEARVALSRRAQPRWFRVVKWVVIVAMVRSLWGRPSFWWWIGGASVLAITLHLVWRIKTCTWTRAWGGWDDVETAQRNRNS